MGKIMRSLIRPTMLSGAGALAAILAVSAANAAVTISTAATANMNCVSGVCTPTAADAVLNVGDLTTMLGSGNVTVNTGTGSLPQQVEDIIVAAPFNWASANGLTLDAYRSVTVDQPIADNGSGAVTLTTNDGGSGGYLSFVSGGSLSFLGTSNSLSVNGAAYTLENSVASLASAITSNSGGNFALANSYDASHDGAYKNAAIATEFSGNFEGLGNTISNLSFKGSGKGYPYVGLFSQVGLGNQPGGAIENIVLNNVTATGDGFAVGGLVGLNIGTISGSFVSGSLTSSFKRGGPEIGVLVGASFGEITRSGATGTVKSKQPLLAGGLAGYSSGPISQSYADCVISGGETSAIGGLAGNSFASVSESYAIGSAKSVANSETGGAVGGNGGTLSQVYSTTSVKGSGDRGGLIGRDNSSPGSDTSDYWDTSTSRVKELDRGAGNVKNDPGIKGLTTAQLQSGLPSGFDPTIWAENPSINNGFPYLINNPPQ
jgi:hypothetical protein